MEGTDLTKIISSDTEAVVFSKTALIESSLSPSLKVTVLVPAVKQVESSKSTEEPVPPTLNENGTVTVPNA